MTRYLQVLLMAAGLAACSEPPTPPTAPTAADVAPPAAPLMTLLDAEQQTHLRSVAVGARGFQDAIDGLLGDPTDQRLATAREAWTHLYRVFNQAAVVLVCRAATDPALSEALARTDLFPILPGYIDGLSQWPGSGIVNDVSVELSREALLAEQAVRSREEASIGFQVLAFLLNGEPQAPRQVVDLQPVSAPPVAPLSAEIEGNGEADSPAANQQDQTQAANNKADAPSAEKAAAQGAHGQWEQSEARWQAADQPANRRRSYLQLTSRILVQDLLTLTSDRSAATVGPHCPLGALRRTSERLIRAEGLSGYTDVEGEYYAADARQIAISGLRQAMAPWLTEASPLHDWLAGRATLPSWPPARADDMAALQQLHAALSAATLAPH